MLSGVGFGETCSTMIACDDDHNECSSLKCACISTAYKKKGHHYMCPS